MRCSPWALAAIIWLCLGCQRGDVVAPEASAATGASAPAERTATPVPASSVPPRLTLLDHGAAPHTPLRYDLAAGTSQASAITINYQMALDMPGIPSPPLVMPVIHADVHTRVLEATDRGFEVRLELATLATGPRPGVSFTVIDALDEALARVQGTTGITTLDRRGFQHGASLSMPDDVPAKIRQLLAETERQIQQMSPPLPEQPVGVGARWRVESQIVKLGVRIDRVASYQLVARTGDTATVEVTIAQSAAPQTVALPGIPGGATAQVTSLSSTGTGKLEIALTRAMPKRGTLRTQTEMAMTIAAASHRQAMTMKTTSSSEVASRDR